MRGLRQADVGDGKASAGKVAAPAAVAKILGIPAARRALRRREIGFDDGHAISITDAWFPPAITDKAPRLADSEPLPAGALAYIAEATGTWAARVTEESAAVAADKETAEALGIQPGSPVLIIRTRHHTADGKAIAYSEASTIAGRLHTRTYTVTGN